MTTLLTAYRDAIREKLLDIVFGQWSELGAPFANSLSGNSKEVIDPEALIWCSLEFFPTEARLTEAVTSWVAESGRYLIRHRISKWAKKADPRSCIWNVLAKGKQGAVDAPRQACAGLDSPKDVEHFCKSLADRLERASDATSRTGKPRPGIRTLLLSARDLLGNDIRSFLLAFLLGNPSGAKLRTIQQWSGYSYRSVAETATRWESVGALQIEHGFCHPNRLQPWLELLRLPSAQPVIVDWKQAFDACIQLLRGLENAQRKGFEPGNPVVRSLVSEAQETLGASVPGARSIDASGHLKALATCVSHTVT